MVLKLKVWRRVCSVVGLDTDILIGTSVWDLEGAKNSTEKPHLTLFFLNLIYLVIPKTQILRMA